MVGTVDGKLGHEKTGESRSLIVELVGPAGAGKTTLLRTLCQRSESIVAGVRPHVRQSEDIPFFLKNGALLLPTLLRLQLSGRRFTRKEITVVTILKGWHRLLECQALRNAAAVVVLDQGPIFELAWLNGFGSENLKTKTAEPWWNGMYAQWASTLDLVVWLDARDAVLAERIDARSKWHMVKGRSEETVSEFLLRFRKSFEMTIAGLTAAGGPRVLRFDTGETSLDQVADEVLAAFGCTQPKKG